MEGRRLSREAAFEGAVKSKTRGVGITPKMVGQSFVGIDISRAQQ